MFWKMHPSMNAEGLIVNVIPMHAENVELRYKAVSKIGLVKMRKFTQVDWKLLSFATLSITVSFEKKNWIVLVKFGQHLSRLKLHQFSGKHIYVIKRINVTLSYENTQLSYSLPDVQWIRKLYFDMSLQAEIKSVRYRSLWDTWKILVSYMFAILDDCLLKVMIMIKGHFEDLYWMTETKRFFRKLLH